MGFKSLNMIWRYVEKKVKNNFYPDLFFWSQNLPRSLRRRIYKQHGLNIRFEVIPENWPPMLYYWDFGKYNGFIFLIFCYIVYRNCFLDFILLCIKSGISFYLITYSIYIVFFIKKYIRIASRFILNIPKNLIPILLIININQFLNIIFNSKKKWYF